MKKIALIIVALIITFVANILVSTGFFRTVENKGDWTIEKEIEVPGAEDITIMANDSFAIISSTDRKTLPSTEEEFGDLYFMDLTSGNYSLKNLTEDFKIPFAPHGISIYKTSYGYKVIAINHTPTGHQLEVFKLIGNSLIHEKTISDPALISPNDVVMVDENNFYVTNDHGYTAGIGKFAEEYLGLSVSNVVYFDGEKFSTVADGIAYANGINYDEKRKLIYVASPRKFTVKVYSQLHDGTLEFIEDIACGTGVDNIELDEEGVLYVGAHPNLLHFKAYATGSKETSPSEIITIHYTGKGDYTVESIYTNDGSAMSASTVAASFGNNVLMGNVMDSKMLILRKEVKVE